MGYGYVSKREYFPLVPLFTTMGKGIGDNYEQIS